MNSLLKRIGTLEDPPAWGIGIVALTFGAAFVAIIAGTMFGYALLGSERAGLVAGWTVSMVLIVVLVVQVVRRDRVGLRLQPTTTPIPLILFIGVGFAVTFDLIGLAATGVFAPAPELLAFDARAMSILDWLLAIAFMVMAQPIAEELVFRGVTFPVVRTLMGAWGGLIVAALLYALFHLLAYPAPVDTEPLTGLYYGLIQPFLAGIVIGAARAYTGSTRGAIVAHAAFGLFAVLKLLLLAG